MRLDLCGHLKAEATVSARGHAKGASETSEGCVSIWAAEMVEWGGCETRIHGGGNWEEKVIRGVLVCAGVSSKRGVRDTRCRYKLAEGLIITHIHMVGPALPCARARESEWRARGR